MSKSAALAEKLRQEGKKTEAFFRQLPQDTWDLQLYADGAMWSIRQVLVHIFESEGSLLKLFRVIASGGAGVAKEFDIDEYNATAVAKIADRPVSEVIAEFVSHRQEMAAFAASLADEDLERRGRHPFLGEARLEEMLRLLYLHVNLHMRDIRKRLDEEHE